MTRIIKRLIIIFLRFLFNMILEDSGSIEEKSGSFFIAEINDRKNLNKIINKYITVLDYVENN